MQSQGGGTAAWETACFPVSAPCSTRQALVSHVFIARTFDAWKQNGWLVVLGRLPCGQVLTEFKVSPIFLVIVCFSFPLCLPLLREPRREMTWEGMWSTLVQDASALLCLLPPSLMLPAGTAWRLGLAADSYNIPASLSEVSANSLGNRFVYQVSRGLAKR